MGLDVFVCVQHGVVGTVRVSLYGVENEVTASSPEDYTVETAAVWSE